MLESLDPSPRILMPDFAKQKLSAADSSEVANFVFPPAPSKTSMVTLIAVFGP